jgi:hypothetical protein
MAIHGTWHIHGDETGAEKIMNIITNSFSLSFKVRFFYHYCMPGLRVLVNCAKGRNEYQN